MDDNMPELYTGPCCPRCGHVGVFTAVDGRLQCPACGEKLAQGEA